MSWLLNKINRRQFIKKSALAILAVVGTVAARKLIVSRPAMGLQDPYAGLPGQKPVIPPYNNKTLFFNEHQYALVATLAALTLPTDDDPGATEAGVVDYIDRIVGDSEIKQASYRSGLKQLDVITRKVYGNDQDFLGLSLENQINLLNLLNKRLRTNISLLGRVGRRINAIRYSINLDFSCFLSEIRKDVLIGYYSNPVSWKSVGYYGPPNPNGYEDFSDPPSSMHYSGSVRLVDNVACNTCHEKGAHPRGKLIDHLCMTCHRPHSPWPYDKEAFYLENHIGVVFPNPDRKTEKQ